MDTDTLKLRNLFQYRLSKKTNYQKLENPLSFEEMYKILVNNYNFNQNASDEYKNDVYQYYLKTFESFISFSKSYKDNLAHIFKNFKYYGKLTGFNTSKDYYTFRGYTEKEIVNILNKRQDTFSKMSETKKQEYREKLRITSSNKYLIDTHGIDKATSIIKNKGKSKNPKYISKKFNISIDDAKEYISETAKDAANKFWSSVRNGDCEYTGNTNLKYYLNQGLSIEDATIALKERQTTFSYKKCIEKYGIDEGTRIFNKRQEKWQKTLQLKTPEEKLEILIRKTSHINTKFYSNESKIFFDRIIEIFKNDFSNNLFYANNEYFLYNKDLNKIMYYDFTDLDNRLIIEYNGSLWHASEKNKNTFKNPFSDETWEECLKKDNNKKNNAEKNGFKVLVIWDYMAFSEKINLIRNFIKNNK
jgi:hypothetical protein